MRNVLLELGTISPHHVISCWEKPAIAVQDHVDHELVQC